MSTPKLSNRRLPFKKWQRAAVIPLVLAGFLLAYATTLQTQINGSSDEYMIDVGEIQVALNVWGTIHHTGYPLFAIIGNLFTLPLRLVGLEPAAAASLYATAWGMIALAGFGLLIGRLTGRVTLGILSAIVLGLARSIWIHNVIAEVYSMSLAITMLMLVVALWPNSWDTRRRFLWLALLGGIGVSHHRAVAFIAPGLLLALWPHLRDDPRHWSRTIPQAVGLFLLGFLAYAYLPIRDWMDGAWVYGEPGTWSGFWIEFMGREADRLVTLPENAAGWVDNIRDVWDILAREITLPGLLISLIGLGVAVTVSPYRRAAQVIALSAAGPLLFAIAYHTAVLPEAILMPVIMALIFGVALLIDWMARFWRPLAVVAAIGLAGWSAALILVHHDWIHDRVTDPTGLETIARVDRLPRDGKPAFTLPWGPRYAAAAYSRLVTGENDDVLMVDHKGNFRQILADGYQLYTEPETFYIFPPDWWRDQLGRLYLSSGAPEIVQLMNTPTLAGANESDSVPIIYGIAERRAWLSCDDEAVYLHIVWEADSRPTADPSIFVHLTGDEPAPVLISADSRYPVYGFYPFTVWSPGEVVRDDFILPRLPGGTQVRFGLYEQNQRGEFINYGETSLPVAGCQPYSAILGR